MSTPTTISIDGVDYVRADSVTQPPDGDHVIVRSRDAGVFAGVLVSRDGTEVELSNARRLWKWDGAMTLSELATAGTTKPNGCKFAVPVSLTVLGVCEVIPMTAKAVASLAGVKVWAQ